MVIINEEGPHLEISGYLFTELTTNIPHGKYYQFLLVLDHVKYTDAFAKLTQHQMDFSRALRHFFEEWENRGQATREKLKNALQNAELGGLRFIVDKHFAQDNALSSDVNTMNRPNSEVTGTNHQRRPDVHDAMSTTAGQIPPPVQQQSQEQEVVSSQTEPSPKSEERHLLSFEAANETKEGEKHQRSSTKLHVSGREWIMPLTIAVGVAAIAFFIYKGYTHKA